MSNTTTSPRRTFVNLAETIRVSALPNADRVALVAAITKAEKKNAAFDANRFAAHALMLDGDAKWAHNVRTGKGFQPAAA